MIIYVDTAGRVLAPGTAFNLDGCAYPANWLALASDQDLIDRGIVKTSVADPVVDVEAAKRAVIAAAWMMHDQRLSSYIVQVPINGVAAPFGCDPVSRENIMGINALIAQEMGGLLPAGTVTNPRPFTPKGQSVPVQVTHVEFAQIGAAMAGAKDSHYVAYAAHKAAINALTSAVDVAAYDITTGWPT